MRKYDKGPVITFDGSTDTSRLTVAELERWLNSKEKTADSFIDRDRQQTARLVALNEFHRRFDYATRRRTA